jgi:plastocyanin
MVNLPHPRRLFTALALALALLAAFAVSALGSSSRSAQIGDFYFHPGKTTIGSGTKVTWSWKGALNHNVTVKSGPSKFHSKSQARGTFSWTFRKRGTYHLYCTIHPGMKETIYVH